MREDLAADLAAVDAELGFDRNDLAQDLADVDAELGFAQPEQGGMLSEWIDYGKKAFSGAGKIASRMRGNEELFKFGEKLFGVEGPKTPLDEPISPEEFKAATNVAGQVALTALPGGMTPTGRAAWGAVGNAASQALSNVTGGRPITENLGTAAGVGGAVGVVLPPALLGASWLERSIAGGTTGAVLQASGDYSAAKRLDEQIAEVEAAIAALPPEATDEAAGLQGQLAELQAARNASGPTAKRTATAATAGALIGATGKPAFRAAQKVMTRADDAIARVTGRAIAEGKMTKADADAVAREMIAQGDEAPPYPPALDDAQVERVQSEVSLPVRQAEIKLEQVDADTPPIEPHYPATIQEGRAGGYLAEGPWRKYVPSLNRLDKLDAKVAELEEYARQVDPANVDPEAYSADWRGHAQERQAQAAGQFRDAQRRIRVLKAQRVKLQAKAEKEYAQVRGRLEKSWEGKADALTDERTLALSQAEAELAARTAQAEGRVLGLATGRQQWDALPIDSGVVNGVPVKGKADLLVDQIVDTPEKFLDHPAREWLRRARPQRAFEAEMGAVLRKSKAEVDRIGETLEPGTRKLHELYVENPDVFRKGGAMAQWRSRVQEPQRVRPGEVRELLSRPSALQEMIDNLPGGPEQWAGFNQRQRAEAVSGYLGARRVREAEYQKALRILKREERLMKEGFALDNQASDPDWRQDYVGRRFRQVAGDPTVGPVRFEPPPHPLLQNKSMPEYAQQKPRLDGSRPTVEKPGSVGGPLGTPAQDAVEVTNGARTVSSREALRSSAWAESDLKATIYQQLEGNDLAAATKAALRRRTGTANASKQKAIADLTWRGAISKVTSPVKAAYKHTLQAALPDRVSRGLEKVTQGWWSHGQVNALADAEKYVDQLPSSRHIDMIADAEQSLARGDMVIRGDDGKRDPALSRIMQTIATHLDSRWQMVRSLGPGFAKHYIKNYMVRPRYKIVEGAPKEVLEAFGKWQEEGAGGASRMKGTPTFMRKRVFGEVNDFYAWVRKHPGFGEWVQLEVTNPVTLGIGTVGNVDDFIARILIHRDLEAMEAIRFVPEGGPPPLQGWQKLERYDVPTFDDLGELKNPRGAYYAKTPAAKLINNWNSPGIDSVLGTGAVYDFWRTVSNRMIKFRLGLSAFHFTNEAMNHAASDAAYALQTLSRAPIEVLRDKGKAWAYVKEGMKGLGRAAVPYASFHRHLRIGNDMFRSHFLDEGGQVIRDTMQWYMQSNPAWATEFDTSHDLADIFMKYLQEHPDASQATQRGMQAILAADTKITHALDAISAPLFSYTIPQAKAGAFFDLVQFELDKLGPSAALLDKLKVVHHVADVIDNRFGMLNYDNLFIARGMKQLAFAAMQAPGWNIGSWREFGKGIFGVADAAASAATGNAPKLTPEMAFTLFGLWVPTVVYGGMYEYFRTGAFPQVNPDDWLQTAINFAAPRNGKGEYDEKANTGDRDTIVAYSKDFLSLWHDLPTTVLHKLNPLAGSIGELGRNKDYFGGEVIGKDSPALVPEGGQSFLDDTKAGQLLKFAGKQITPYSFSGAMQTKAREDAGIKDVALNLAGIAPAAGFLRRTYAENVLYDARMDRRQIGARTPAESQRAELKSSITGRLRSSVLRPDKPGSVRRGQTALLDARRALQQGQISMDDVKSILENSAEESLVRQFRDATLDDKLAAWRVMRPTERRKVAPLLFGSPADPDRMEDHLQTIAKKPEDQQAPLIKGLKRAVNDWRKQTALDRK